MIRRPNNWNEVQEFTDRKKLPLGAYVCKVIKAVIQNNEYGEQLCILFDIVEGENRDFYSRDYNTSQAAIKRWKGVLRYWIPKDDGSEKDEWTKSSFKGMVTSFEKSNPGYQWNWNEASLAGKEVGVLFRNEEWEYEGKTGWAVRPFRAISTESVRSGDYTLPNDKPLKRKTASTYNPNSYPADYSDTNSGFTQLNDTDNDLPF